MMKIKRQIVDDFAGFTPAEMHQIIYYPFGEECPIKMSQVIGAAILKMSPFYNISYSLLKKVNDSDGIKLTAKGNLPGKIIKEIYAEKFFLEHMVESGYSSLKTETNWIILHTAHIVLKMGGLLRKNHGKLLVTKKGQKFITPNNEVSFFYYLSETYSTKYNWAYNDGYPFEEVGQIGFLFLLNLLNQAGNKFQPISKYTQLYFQAFPIFLNQIKEDSFYNKDRLEHIVEVRFFERFAYWFGMLEYEVSEKNRRMDDVKIKQSKLLMQLLNRR